ncbi:mitochondrial import inner membrane translocase subunit Tim9 isoform 1-T4 [Guaruba guarouba]
MAGQISEADQIKQFKEFLGTYNKITENCFLDCIKDFTSREVKPEEYVHKGSLPDLRNIGYLLQFCVFHSLSCQWRFLCLNFWWMVSLWTWKMPTYSLHPIL